LRCATPTTPASYENSSLIINFNNVKVKTLNHSNGDFLPADPVDLIVSDLYTTAGLDPNLPGTYPLAIVRQGSGCNGVYGDASVKLFELALTSAPAPEVRLSQREHDMELQFFFEAEPVEPGSNVVAYFKSYEGPEDSLAAYSDTLDPPAKVVTRENSGSFDGRSAYQNISFNADQAGRLLTIKGSAGFETKTALTGCFNLDCSERVIGGHSQARLNSGIHFLVKAGVVAYTLTGTLGATSDNQNPAYGAVSLIQLEVGDLSEFTVCSSADPSACSGSGTASLASSGTLSPGEYALEFSLVGESKIQSPNFEGQQTIEADGNVNFTLNFVSVP
jgi:hypothetical protein